MPMRDEQGGTTSYELARKAAHYFYTHTERIRYDRFRAAGYMIGSESTVCLV